MHQLLQFENPPHTKVYTGTRLHSQRDTRLWRSELLSAEFESHTLEETITRRLQ